MRVLVLGSTGYIGMHLLQALKSASWAEPAGASRTRNSTPLEGVAWLALDTCDPVALTRSLKGFDAVVNCVAGDRRSIADGARMLVDAAVAAGCQRIIHLSTMSVYGDAEGLIDENSPPGQQLGWYGQAKRQAESHMADFVKQGGEAVIFRPGCVFGPGSELWVGRTGRWLQAGRLGDLGAAGDGWSNLVHVDDVCQAVLAALQRASLPGEFPVFNLAAPDSPRWNDYFVDLAVGIEAIPARRISARQVRLDSLLAGPPLKIAERLLKHLGKQGLRLPDPMPPGVVRLWSQQIHLDATLATQDLNINWTPYAASLSSSAAWFSRVHGPKNPAIGKAICTH